MKIIIVFVLVPFIASISALRCHQCRKEEVGKFSGETIVHEDMCYHSWEQGSPMNCTDSREWCYFKYKHQNRNTYSPKDVWKGCKMPSDNAEHRRTKDGMICADEIYNQKNPHVVASICYCKTDFCNTKAVDAKGYVAAGEVPGLGIRLYASSIFYIVCALVAIFN